MRAILLLLSVTGFAIGGLYRPILGLYGYVWYALMRPDVLAWSTGPYSQILAAVTLLGVLRRYHMLPRLFLSPLIWLLVLMQIPIYLSVVFAIKPEYSVDPYALYFRVVLMSLVVPVLIETEQDLRTFMVLMAVSLGVLGSKFGLFALIHGGVRFTDGPGGFLSDNNCFALAMVMAIPLLVYARPLVESQLMKLALGAMTVCTAAAVVMTFSRGAGVTMMVVFLLFLWRSKRKVLGVALIALSIGPAIYLVHDDYFERMATLQDPTQEASANSRIMYAKVAYRMAKDYPWVGVGFGTFNQMDIQTKYLPYKDAKTVQVIHNTYLQMLTDSGVFAFVLYVVLLWSAVFWLGRSAKRMQAVDPVLANIPVALQTALIAYAVGSLSLSRISFDVTYYLLTTAAAWQFIAYQRHARADEESEAVQPEADQPEAETEPSPVPA